MNGIEWRVSIIILITALSSSVILYYQWHESQRPRHRTNVVIEGVEYPHDIFDETFNYSFLIGKEVSFCEPLNRSEFAAEYVYTHHYEFSSLDEAWLLLEELGTPKVVIGFARWLSNGTYVEAVKRCYGYDPGKPWDPDCPSEIYKIFGDPRGDYPHAYYTVCREGPSFNGGIDVWVDRLHIGKRARMAQGENPIWSLRMKLYISPPYPANFDRFPIYARRW